MNRIVFAAILAVSTVTVHAVEPPKEANTNNFPSRMNMRPELLKEFDKDGDGKLNDQERAAMMEARKAKGEMMRKAMEKQFDKDGDGKLNDEERAAMMAARKAQFEKFMKAREKEFDKDGDGKLNDEERAAMQADLQKHRANGPQYQEMLKRFDKDGDGKLNDEERKAMMEERAKHMQPPPAAPTAAKVPTT